VNVTPNWREVMLVCAACFLGKQSSIKLPKQKASQKTLAPPIALTRARVEWRKTIAEADLATGPRCRRSIFLCTSGGNARPRLGMTARWFNGGSETAGPYEYVHMMQL
jgi:hypothetical protein